MKVEIDVTKLLDRRHALELELETIKAMLNLIGVHGTRQIDHPEAANEAANEISGKRQRRISAEGRARIAEAQRARWAKVKRDMPPPVEHRLAHRKQKRVKG